MCAMDAQLIDRRRKLTYADRAEIHRRFFDRDVSGETVIKIADDFAIHRQVASRIARKFTPKENAPASEQARG